MRPLACVLVLAGCLDFDPGTPDPQAPGDPTPDMAKPSTPPQPMPDMATTPSMPPQPGADMATPPPAPLGVELCDATLTLSGTWVQGLAPPLDFPGGCWPDGTWTFTATVTQNNCTSGPQVEAQYQFTVVEDLDYNDTITYNTDPTNMYITTKISGGEGGVCVGSFKIYSADGKTITNLRPAMQADLSINGAADIRVYDTDQKDLTMRNLFLVAGVMGSLALWLVLTPLQPAPRTVRRAPVAVALGAVAAAAIPFLPRAVAPRVDAPARHLDPPALARRLDEQIPSQLYAEAAHCYQGGLPADQRLDLSYRVRVKNGQLSISEAGITSGAIGDGTLQRCILDRVLAFGDHDDLLPDLDENGQLFLRVGGFKPFLAQVAQDGDQPPHL